MSRILALGDSFTNHDPVGPPGNFSYTRAMYLPQLSFIDEHGVKGATLDVIEDLHGFRTAELIMDDVFILMGRAVFPEKVTLCVDAAISMLSTAKSKNALTMFMTQPAFYQAYAGPFQQEEPDMACWNQIREWCEANEVVFMNNYFYWIEHGFRDWWWLYTDEVHLTECGAHFLANSVDWITRAIWGL